MWLSNADQWVICGVALSIMVAAVVANCFDPNSKTNDLAEILDIDNEIALARARGEIRARLAKR